jgi:hypothetical protein
MINNVMNKYQRWYDLLIETRRGRILPAETYAENHHIIPRSLGGTDSKDNLIRLLPREHFIAHLLLARIHCGSNGMKMAHALRRMISGHKGKRYTPTSRTYQLIRSISMEKCSGDNNPMWGRTGELHPTWGRKEEIYNDEFKEKISQTSKGRKWSEEQRAKRRESQLKYWADPENRVKQSERIKKVERTAEWNAKISEGQKGRVQSPETRAKISVARKQQK